MTTAETPADGHEQLARTRSRSRHLCVIQDRGRLAIYSTERSRAFDRAEAELEETLAACGISVSRKARAHGRCIDFWSAVDAVLRERGVLP